jgi:hypothetical protein
MSWWIGLTAWASSPKRLDQLALQLLVKQGLGLSNVFQPGEGVFAFAVVQAGLIHLASKPLAAIEADVDAEREPGLDARVHEAEDGMNLVMIKVYTLALPVTDF